MIWRILTRELREAFQNRVALALTLGAGFVLPCVLFRAMNLPPDAPATALQTAVARGVRIYLPLLGVVPLSVGLNAAASSFAGELENGSLIPLLMTPASDLDIFIGKLLASLAPMILLGFTAQTVFVGLCLARTHMPVADLLSPTTSAEAVIGVLVAVVSTEVCLLVSTQVRSAKAAQQYSALISIPALIGTGWGLPHLAEATEVVAWLCVLAMVLLAFILVVVSRRMWRKERILR